MKKVFKISGIAIAVFILFSFLFLVYINRDTSKIRNYERPTIYFNPLISYRPLTFEYYAKNSQAVIVGKVVKKEETTETVQAVPGTDVYELQSKLGTSSTTVPRLYVAVEVEKVLKGRVDDKQIELCFALYDPFNKSDLFEMQPGEKFVFMIERRKDKPDVWWVASENRFIFKLNNNNTVYPACWWYDERYKKRFFNITLDELEKEFKKIDKLEKVPMYDEIPKEAWEKLREGENRNVEK
ncbi:hypothetical protein [Caldicellulosiruptor acetigenus]|uniref:Uncharacterized protein n=1 Tax=Caldicellulosiruptor acetigenus 6A TaxID=632516 RepID=G2PYE2_9FIRM|nr:hypothetical protein [Caldicellulosiruptor acetigenus]AEM73992.1 hypothetical protein Calla_1373 [Caldicellulosiruptor acetigenus 6A]